MKISFDDWMKQIILDTNFLMIPGTLKVDIFSEIKRICHFQYELAVLDQSIQELNHIRAQQQGKHRRAAQLALQLIKSKGLKIITTPRNKNVDQLILDMVNREKNLVATNDSGLKKKLKGKNIPLIVLRQKKYLMIGE